MMCRVSGKREASMLQDPEVFYFFSIRYIADQIHHQMPKYTAPSSRNWHSRSRSAAIVYDEVDPDSISDEGNAPPSVNAAFEGDPHDMIMTNFYQATGSFDETIQESSLYEDTRLQMELIAGIVPKGEWTALVLPELDSKDCICSVSDSKGNLLLVKCWNCNLTGHMARNCPSPIQKEPNGRPVLPFRPSIPSGKSGRTYRPDVSMLGKFLPAGASPSRIQTSPGLRRV